MIYLIDVCLNKDENAYTQECKDGILKDGLSVCNLSFGSCQPYFLFELNEIIDNVEVNRGYAIQYGKMRKDGLSWGIGPTAFKKLLLKGPKQLDWVFTLLSLGTTQEEIDEYLNKPPDDLFEMLKFLGMEKEIIRGGEFRTRKVERFFDSEGNMQSTYTCFLFTPSLWNEDEINKTFRYHGRKVVDENGKIIPLKVVC